MMKVLAISVFSFVVCAYQKISHLNQMAILKKTRSILNDEIEPIAKSLNLSLNDPFVLKTCNINLAKESKIITETAQLKFQMEVNKKRSEYEKELSIEKEKLERKVKVLKAFYDNKVASYTIRETFNKLFEKVAQKFKQGYENHLWNSNAPPPSNGIYGAFYQVINQLPYTIMEKDVMNATDVKQLELINVQKDSEDNLLQSFGIQSNNKINKTTINSWIERHPTIQAAVFTELGLPSNTSWPSIPPECFQPALSDYMYDLTFEALLNEDFYYLRENAAKDFRTFACHLAYHFDGQRLEDYYLVDECLPNDEMDEGSPSDNGKFPTKNDG